MPFKVIITRDFDHMSETAARLVVDDMRAILSRKDAYTLGLATGNTPTGLYKHLAKAANEGAFDSSRIRSFNLDEYVGLPGSNAQQRTLHAESYSFFMIQELFGLLRRKFAHTALPGGNLIDQDRMEDELAHHPDDWEEQGRDRGKALVIREDARSDYLRWIRRDILDKYEADILEAGGIDLQIIGVGGKGHVAFHEAGIPFENNRMLLVRLDGNTIRNAVIDGHFAREEHRPRYAVSMGAELVYSARTVLLLANGERKAGPVARSLLEDATPDVPISCCHHLHRSGGRVIYLLDRAAATNLDGEREALRRRGIDLEDRSGQRAERCVHDLTFFRDPRQGSLG